MRAGQKGLGWQKLLITGRGTDSRAKAVDMKKLL
jgi:hypothetical protein